MARVSGSESVVLCNHHLEERKSHCQQGEKDGGWLAGYRVTDIGPQQASCPALRRLKFKGIHSFHTMQNLTLKFVDSS